MDESVGDLSDEFHERCSTEENSSTMRISQRSNRNSCPMVWPRRATFYKTMFKYFHQGMCPDVNVICTDQIFRCHRKVLAAASDYFHHEFGVVSTQDVHLSDIDGSTFELILRYMYQDEIVSINDGNVFGLLKASNLLKIRDIEESCVHHLTQKSIPMDHALQIFFFAQSNYKIALVKATSQFILQHLDHFCHERDFFYMSLANFSALYAHSPNSSASQEKELLCHCHNSTLVDSNDDGSGPGPSSSPSGEVADASDVMETDKLGKLYVYVGTAAYKTGDHQRYPSTKERFGIFSMLGKGEEDQWRHSHTISAAAIEKMRIVESGDRLYALKLCDRQWTFSSSTAIDLSNNVQDLTPPRGSDCVVLNMRENFDSKDISLCPLRTQNSMYLCGLYENVIDFQCYDIELDLWTPVPVVSEICKPKSLMHDDARLYIIGQTGSSYFAAYDPRVGEVQELDNGGLIRLERDTSPGCYHDGRFYVSEKGEVIDNNKSEYSMAIYDPRAGRWDVQQLPHHVKDTSGRRLESFDNRLWMFDFQGHSTYITTYDSHLQMWDLSKHHESLNRAVQESSLGTVGFLDVMATKSF